MPGGPKAASGWPSESAPRRCQAWGKRQRLLRATEFAAVSNAQAPWRAARRWIAMSASMQLCPSPLIRDNRWSAPSGVRFGFTVARRHARRAVVRNTVKRILREAARVAGEALRASVPAQRIDIVLRLKAPLPDRTVASWSSVKAQLRREAQSLIGQLRHELGTRSESQTQGSVTGPLKART